MKSKVFMLIKKFEFAIEFFKFKFCFLNLHGLGFFQLEVMVFELGLKFFELEVTVFELGLEFF